MYGNGKSDSSIVSKKQSNKDDGTPSLAEIVEKRELVKGNPVEQTKGWTQRQVTLPHALDRIRQAVQKDKDEKMTALWHHVYHTEGLRESFSQLKSNAAAGVDGQTWRQYVKDLDENLEDLSQRLQRGAYQAKPVKRVYVPKEDGHQRPIGIPALEDKIVQRATVSALETIYETEFKGFSYGFRPGRSPHDALDAVTVGIEQKKVNWILDADIAGYYDTIDQEKLIQFIQYRIADQRVIRHIRKWLQAGVLAAGQWQPTETGVPQGSSISPLLSNIYLHYVLDEWAQTWREQQAHGDVIIVRFADDFILGFQHRHEATQFQVALVHRLRQFNLSLHPHKTRLIEFGRFARERRLRRGQGKPETFDFLGFTHSCSQTRRGKFTIRRETIAKRLRRKLRQIKKELRQRLHQSVEEVGTWLGRVLSGHYRYYGVSRNTPRLTAFLKGVIRLWYHALCRRSQKGRLTKAEMYELVQQWLPSPRIYHPYPTGRLDV